MANWANRWPLATFFGLAFAFTWALLPAARNSVVVSLIALLGPAAAALVTAALRGRESLQDLRARITRWRVPIRWYVVALLLPIAVSALRTGIEYFAGAHGPIHVQPVTALGLVVFVLVAGEEIGWRGFALPHLLARFSPVVASIILGVMWALWHLPLFFLSGMPQYGTPFVSYVPYLVALSMILTWLAQHSMGSVVIATLFHGAVNTFGIVNAGADIVLRGWTNAVSYGVVALGLACVRSGRPGR